MRYFSLVLAGLVLLNGCGSTDNTGTKTEVDRMPRLETMLPERVQLPIQIELSAVVEPMEKADLCARVAGVIETLQLDPKKPEADIGREVSAGEPLIKLYVPDLEAEKKYKEALLEQAKKQRDQTTEAQKVADKELQEAREQEKRYQAEFYRSQEKHDRTMKLVQSGSLNRELAEETKNQLEASRSAWQAAKAQIETKQAKAVAMEADLKLAEVRIQVAQTDLKRLQVMLDYSVIRAPFDGIVTKRWVDRGAMVKDPATPLLTVMRTDIVRILLDIPQKDILLVNATEQNPNPDGKGDAVVFRVPSLGDQVPRGEFPGHITRTSGALDPATRTMRAEVHFHNQFTTKDGTIVRPLRPGMYGTANVILENVRYVQTVPSTALVRRGNKVYVFHVANPTGKPAHGTIARKEVELGQDDGRRVEIRSGLTGEELILVKGIGHLHDGDNVIAIRSREP
ncbi:MAG TPA: efflux RND transporter periplasmic adaptor subunit [Gemmataceae bacterium]|nr:efflux RND transporter periplasmic adaptor subunit [Gemmataceae bacterium]